IEREQRFVLAKDAAELAIALLRLDNRYRWAPGWQRLGGRRDKLAPRQGVQNPHASGVATVALATIEWADQQITTDDYVVDGLGWRPRPQLIDATSDDPMERALAALHNTVVHLGREFPRALALRGLARMHRETSLHAVRLAKSAGDDVARSDLKRRAQTYAALASIMRRSVGGNLGGGNRALGEATVSLDHLNDAPTATREQVQTITAVLAEIDSGIGTRLRQGIDDRRYFVKDGLHLAARPDGGIYQAVDRYVAVTDVRRGELLQIAQTLAGASAAPTGGFESARRPLADLVRADATPSPRAQVGGATTKPVVPIGADTRAARVDQRGPAIAL
ncbi:MAG: hypothetical protein ACRDJC_11345, partial [Thermomicrobiales bacterium]